MRTLQFLLLLSLAGMNPTRAQSHYDPAIFSPLSAGNYWEFEVAKSETGTPDELYYELYRLDGDTTISGETYQNLESQRVDAEQREIARWTCFVRRAAGGNPQYALSDRGCPSAVPLQVVDTVWAEAERDQTISVGRDFYTFEWTARRASYGQGMMGSGGGRYLRQASGLGSFYQQVWSHGRVDQGGISTSTIHQLVYAEVEGKKYGTRKVVAVQGANWPALTPLVPGSRWTYHIVITHAPAETPGPYLTYEVRPDTVINGVPHRLLAGTELDSLLQPKATWLWGFFTDERGMTREIVPLGESPVLSAIPLLTLAFRQDAARSPRFEITGFDTLADIDGATYRVPATAQYGADLEFDEELEWVSRAHAAGIGVVIHQTGTWQARLVHAKTADAEYGEEPKPPLLPEVPGVGNTLQIVSVYPNPFGDEVNLEVAGDEGAEVTAELFDLLGRRIWTRKMHVSDQHERFELDPGAAGTYLLRICDVRHRCVSRAVVRLP